MRNGFRQPRYEGDPFEAAKKDAESKQKEITDHAVRDLEDPDTKEEE